MTLVRLLFNSQTRTICIRRSAVHQKSGEHSSLIFYLAYCSFIAKLKLGSVFDIRWKYMLLVDLTLAWYCEKYSEYTTLNFLCKTKEKLRLMWYASHSCFQDSLGPLFEIVQCLLNSLPKQGSFLYFKGN